MSTFDLAASVTVTPQAAKTQVISVIANMQPVGGETIRITYQHLDASGNPLSGNTPGALTDVVAMPPGIKTAILNHCATRIAAITGQVATVNLQATQ